MERTLLIVKPDGVARGLIGEVISRIERRGLKIVGLKMVQVSRELAERHYQEHREKPFFSELVRYITSAPVVVAVVEGADAVRVVRRMVGATSPAEAEPGSIRGDLAMDIGRNVVHASDSPESAKREVELFFSPGEILSYRRADEPWVYERSA